MPLTVERYDVVAVLEHHRLNTSAEAMLQVKGVPYAGSVILARVEQQHWLTDAPQRAPDGFRQAAKLEHGTAWRAELTGL